MNIAICTPMKGRFLLAEAFWAGVDRLKATWAPHETLAYVAGDEPRHRELCEEHGGVWVEHPNQPLSLKWNALVRRAWLAGADAVVILGQDDLIDAPMANAYKGMFDAGGPEFWAGTRGCTMIEPRTRRALRLAGHASPRRLGEVIGAGRVFSRAALDRVNGRPWPPHLQRGLDFRQTLAFLRAGIEGVDMAFGPDHGAIVDVKTGENIWSFNHIARHRNVAKPCDYEAVMADLPEAPILRQLEAA